MHDKDVADLIRNGHNAYYKKVFDSSLAYDDLALHGEHDLEKVCGSVALLLSPNCKRYSGPIYGP
jgi:hypothetical protein